MPVAEFVRDGGSAVHSAYQGSMLAPVAPEYATGEVLVGATYRKLLLGIRERTVALSRVRDLPDYLTPSDAWRDLLELRGGLASPPRAGQGSKPPPQLMPLVPEVARYAAVLGERPRRRWEPGNFLLSAMKSGHGPANVASAVDRLRSAVEVGPTDDIFARFVQDSLERATQNGAAPPSDPADEPEERELASAWRESPGERPIPPERFARDLEAVIDLKHRLTRRQWTVLLEALLRLGLGSYALWICGLNMKAWDLCLAALSGQAPPREVVERECWSGSSRHDIVIELGRDGWSPIRKRLQDYVQARIGLNLLLHALDDAGSSWQAIGVPVQGTDADPVAALVAFLAHVAANAAAVTQAVRDSPGGGPVGEVASRLADADPRLLALRSGPAKNLLEFVRHCLGQIQPHEQEQKSYDQGYLLYLPSKTSPVLPVQPGPASLIMIVHACCRSLGSIPASMDDLVEYLAGYGIGVPAGELQDGKTGQDLERLGLVVDSPDARGGRLLVDPF